MLRAMSRLLATVLLIVALAGCGDGASTGTDGRVVAEIGDRVVTVSEVQDYLDAVLAIGGAEDGSEDESITEDDLNRVLSRLFDGFLEEELLLYEAERLGVEVEPWEVEVYLGLEPDEVEDPDDTPVVPEPDDRSYRLARRNLMVQKLRAAVVAQEVEISEADVDAYLRRYGASMLPDDHVIVRRLTLSGKKEADEVRREIIQKSMPFDKAAVVFGGEPPHGQPEQMAIGSLPEAMQRALEKLKPGEISRPVEFGGAYQLILLEAWPAKGAVSQERLRERARDELQRIRSAEVSHRLGERLRYEIAIRIHSENLPFDYVED